MERRPQYETWPADMGASPLAPDARLFLDAEIRPNRSLANPGFYALMAAVAVISFSAGIAFMMIGAWPVLGFFGLDVLLVWLAFKLSYRDGRKRETIQITSEEIRVARTTPFGHQTAFRLPAAWTRVEVTGEGEPDVQARLTASGKSLIIGAMLSPRERESLAQAVGQALKTARQDINPAQSQEAGGV